MIFGKPPISLELTRSVIYTIQPGDGVILFASDRVNGMTMSGGTTFHVDYVEAWDPPTRTIWERPCIRKLLNCSDGELGDGRMLKRSNLSYRAATELIAAPAAKIVRP